MLFTVRGELLRSHPEVVTAYVAENIRSARWARSHPEEAYRYIARDTGGTEEDVALGYSGVADRLEPSLAPELVAALEHRKEFLFREGFLERDFSIAEFIAPAPLAEARKIVDAEDAQRAA